jgi:hypothetical protein
MSFDRFLSFVTDKQQMVGTRQRTRSRRMSVSVRRISREGRWSNMKWTGAGEAARFSRRNLLRSIGGDNSRGRRCVCMGR